MAPRTRITSKKAQNKKLAVFLSDFDKQCKTRVQDMERQGNNLCKQVETFYVQEIYKIPKAIRETRLEDFLASDGHSTTAKLGQIEEEINNALQLPPLKKPPLSAKSKTPAVPAVAQTSATPANCAPLKKQMGTATLCRKAIPNEVLWSSRGSPVVVDPRAALGQGKVKAAVAVKEGTITITGSPLNDKECPRLDSADLEEINKVQAKLAKIVEMNEQAAANENGGLSKLNDK